MTSFKSPNEGFRILYDQIETMREKINRKFCNDEWDSMGMFDYVYVSLDILRSDLMALENTIKLSLRDGGFL